MSMSTTARSRHKASDSCTSSEFSYFDTNSTSATDHWSSYFEGLEPSSGSEAATTKTDDASKRYGFIHSNPTWATALSEVPTPNPPHLKSFLSPDDGSNAQSTVGRPSCPRNSKATSNTAIAIAYLNELLRDSSSSTQDILDAMWSPSWDSHSLQQWFDQSPQSGSDLALYKIMYSLRYTPDDDGPYQNRRV